jgi:lipid-binding SYLF domain-containing protein
MRKWIGFVMVCLLAVPAFAQEKEKDRLENAGHVMQEILDIPDGIPHDLLSRAECVLVLPSVKKAAIGIGGNYGRGVMTCRSGANYTGAWGPPAFYALEGGNIGFQLGGEATDFVLLVMNNKGARSLLHSKVKLGADAAAAAGPKGRDAQAATDVVMKAEILTYSRSKGLFAGVSLEGTTLRSDGGANENFYHKKLDAEDIIVHHKVGMPADARTLISALNKAAPRNKSNPRSLKTPKKS